MRYSHRGLNQIAMMQYSDNESFSPFPYHVVYVPVSYVACPTQPMPMPEHMQPMPEHMQLMPEHMMLPSTPTDMSQMPQQTSDEHEYDSDEGLSLLPTQQDATVDAPIWEDRANLYKRYKMAKKSKQRLTRLVRQLGAQVEQLQATVRLQQQQLYEVHAQLYATMSGHQRRQAREMYFNSRYPRRFHQEPASEDSSSTR